MEKGLVEALKGIFDYKLLSVFTCIPAKVQSVNYKHNHLNAQPLIKTRRSDGTERTSPELFDVPIFVLSAGRGNTRITMPVKVGDTVLILYSQRSLEDFYGSDGKTIVDSKSEVTHGMYPILALPCLFTKDSAVPIDPSNLIVENGSTKVTIQPDGNVIVDAPQMTINANVVINGDTTINGNETINGNNVTSGNQTTGGNTSVAGTLTQNGVDVGGDHRHDQVQSGIDTSGTVV